MCGNKNNTDFHGWNVPEDFVGYGSFAIISINSVLFMKANITCSYI